MCLLSYKGNCEGSGIFHIILGDGLLQRVSARSFGFLEAYVVCLQHDLPKISNLRTRPRYIQIASLHITM